PRLPACARRRRAPGLDRSRGRLELRVGPLQRAARRRARVDRGRGRRGRAGRDGPLLESVETPRGPPGRLLCVPMSLRPLLTYAHENPEVQQLAEAAVNGAAERAFVSASLRPYLLAALLDSSPDKPALVVAGDDRAARDLAADLKTFLSPRVVRFYPARGVRYESHLAPPPHLVGLRVAALDALAGEAAVVVASAAALAEKVPDPEL